MHGATAAQRASLGFTARSPIVGFRNTQAKDRELEIFFRDTLLAHKAALDLMSSPLDFWVNG